MIFSKINQYRKNNSRKLRKLSHRPKNSKLQILRYIFKYQLMERLKVKYSLNYLKMLFLSLHKISGHFELEKKELVKMANHYILRIVYFTELFLSLWLKEEILHLEMELKANQYMEVSLKIKTLILSIILQDYYLWQILDQTLMVVNSSLPSFHAHI